MIQPPKPTKSPDIKRRSVKNWLKGVVTAYDSGRTPIEGLKTTGNTILDQNGTIRPRPSLSLYGTAPTGTVRGEAFEYTKVSGITTENYLITMQTVGLSTKIYISKDGGAWSVCNGKTYDDDAAAHFFQVDQKVVVMNGVDNLSYLDIATATVIPFTALSTPSAPTLTTNTGLTGTTFTITYRITANSTVGETDASSALSVQVSTDRDLWNPTSQSLTIGWSSVASAQSYNVYMGTVSGYEYLIASGVNGLSYTDNGVAKQDVTRLYPTSNSTAGPKVTRGTVINGIPYFVGDADNPYRVWYGGSGANALDLSPANGGGWVEIGLGTKELPVHVKPFRDGRGNPQTTVLCRGTNGHGKRYLLSPNSTTLGDTVISFYDVIEDNGQDGTDSPDGIVQYNDSLYYPSRDGFKTTGTKPQLQNILSTNRISNTIQPDVKSLNTLAMDKCVGMAAEGRAYWALPAGSETNNQIWVIDFDRDGAWMKPWNIAADWMLQYNDNSGISHHLILKDNLLYEFDYARQTNDNGTPFLTEATSGLIYFSDDAREWGKVLQVIFTVLRPQGTINFTVFGKTEDAMLETVGSETFTAGATVAGWSEAGWGTYGWSNFEAVPEFSGEQTVDVIIEVDEELQWWGYSFATNESGVVYQVSDVIVEYVPLGIRDLT